MTETDVHHEARTAEGALCTLQQFYARQMQLLDDGAVEPWADTFTEDATFVSNAMGAPIVGRPAILRGATQSDEGLRDSGVQRRHLLSNLSVGTGAGGMVVADSYVLIVETAKRRTEVRFNTALRDELVHEQGEWLVRTRYITRDDLG